MPDAPKRVPLSAVRSGRPGVAVSPAKMEPARKGIDDAMAEQEKVAQAAADLSGLKFESPVDLQRNVFRNDDSPIYRT